MGWFNDFFKYAGARYPVGLAILMALFISGAAIVATEIIYHGIKLSGFALPASPGTAPSGGVLAILFVAIWIIAGAIILLLSRDPLEDYFSDIRAALVGHWTLRIETLDVGQGVKTPVKLDYPLRISRISDTRKLRVDFDQTGSHIFEEAQHSSSNVHLSEAEDDHYRLLIRLVARQRLRKAFRNNPFGNDEIVMPMLFDLTFRKEGKKVHHAEGYWYDLDNIVYRVVHRNSSDDADRKAIVDAACKGTGNFRSRVEILPATPKNKTQTA